MRQLTLVTLVTLALAAACGRQPAIDDQMRKDLEAASAASVEFAPMGGGTAVVSGVEQVQPSQPRVAPVRRTNAPAQTPPREQPQAQPSKEPAAVSPASRPKVQPPPPGGYKTVDEVIRNAPFPIKPATSKPPR